MVATLLDDVANGVQVRSVQVSVVFSGFQEVVLPDLLLHLLAVAEPVVLAVLLEDARWPRRVYFSKQHIR